MLLLVGYIVVSHSTRSIVYPSSVSKIRDVDFSGAIETIYNLYAGGDKKGMVLGLFGFVF